MQVRFSAGYADWRAIVGSSPISESGANPMQRKRQHFQLTFSDSLGVPVTLNIRRDHHAEQIMRGLVHSRIKVSIEEVDLLVDVSDEEKCYDDGGIGGLNVARPVEPADYPTARQD